MLNIQSVKEIETLCAKIASRNNISFHDAFECLSEEQQAIYDEYMTRQYKNKLNNMFGADWIKKASPVMLYNVSLKNYKNIFILCNFSLRHSGLCSLSARISKSLFPKEAFFFFGFISCVYLFDRHAKLHLEIEGENHGTSSAGIADAL